MFELGVEGPTSEVPNGDDHNLWTQIHADVISRLEAILGTMDAATNLGLAWSGGSTDAQGALRQLRSDLASVRQLELRMPIVAPMKSGKSTIINAVVGYDLLPARAEAMTTLPTKVILAEGLNQPELIISEQDVAVFSELAKNLRKEVTAKFSSLANRYAHLETLLAQIRDGKFHAIQPSWRGRGDVLEGLTQLNDLLRLAALLFPDQDYIGRIIELPTLRTPFWKRPELDGTESAGTLAIVDTPGPDESGVADRLVGAVATQLKNCHVVLLLLDYTAMGREADEKIRALTEPVVRMIGREKLYVVVNKVDQRRAGDRDADGVRRFVQHDLNLVDVGADQRIFETRGQEALAAARVLSQYPWSDETATIRATPETLALLQELYREKEDRDTALETWTEATLLRRAERVWGRSGLQGLLNRVIGQLRRHAVPVVLTSALTKTEPQLVSLRDAALLRLQAARADRKRVEDQIQTLEQEIQLLARVRSEAPNARQFGGLIEAELNDKLTAFSNFGQDIISKLGTYDNLAEPRKETRGRSRPDTDSGLLNIFKGLLAQFTEALQSVSGGHRERSDGLLEFDSAEEASEYIQQVTSTVLGRLRRAADETRDDMNKEVVRLTSKVVAEQDQKVRPIVARAARRLSEAFDLTLKMPPLHVTSEDIEIESPLPLLEETSQQRTRTVTEKRRRWYTAWLIKVPVTVHETYEEVSRVHLVDLQAIKAQLTAGFDARQIEVSTEVTQYTVDHLMRELDAYFTGVDAYLRRYMHSLEQARADASRSEVEKGEIAVRLDELVSEAKQHLEGSAVLKARLAG